MVLTRNHLLIITLMSSIWMTHCGGGANLPDGGADTGSQCAIICSTTADCCPGESCTAGVCAIPTPCPTGCNWECDRAAGQVCSLLTGLCEGGAPAETCVDDCDCYTGEHCLDEQCRPTCLVDEDCPAGQVCLEGSCRPAACQTREDCAGTECLVCKGGQCTAPPVVCQEEDDCCVGSFCNFGTCTLESEGCLADSDCPDPDLPQCVDHKCVPAEVECQIDMDCPLPGQVCQDQRCVTPGCTPESCATGQWCEATTGLCKPGCDSNDDCSAPQTCNYGTHQCGQADCCGGVCTPGSQVCDPQACQCRDVCVDDLDCPASYTCRQADGQCVCTDLACPAGTHCDPGSGQCMPDAQGCDPAEFTQPIACDASAGGTFESGCESTQRFGSYAKQFTFTGTAGQTAVIDLTSNADAYLYLLGPSGSVLSSNDDGGGSTDARVTYALTADGTYTIEATTFGPGQTGPFTLTLACSDSSDCTEALACGGAVAGTWTPTCVSSQRSGSYARWYTFSGTGGDWVTIELGSYSDTYLYLLDATGAVLDADDDGGPYTDSQIVFSLPTDGTYTIEATTLMPGREDDFDLSLTCSAGSDCEQPIACGQVIAESFTPACEAVNRWGCYSKVFLYQAVANQPITIDLRSSAVDTYLYLYDPDGWLQVTDDDSGSGSNAQITGTPLQSGTWFIEATTYDPYESGPFEIELTCP